MALEHLSLENYRCFAERQDIELRPLTVVIGKNNSGKSALVRAPLVLSTGLPPNARLGIPLDLTRLGEDPPDFADLIHSQAQHRPIGLGMRLTTDDGPVHIEAKVQHVNELRRQVVSHLKCRSPEGVLRMDWRLEDDSLTGHRRMYFVEIEQSLTPALLPVIADFAFTGLIPAGDDDHDDENAYLASLGISELSHVQAPEIRYISPFRTRALRTTRLHERSPHEDEYGRGTDGIIVYDKVLDNGRLTAKVNEYLQAYLPGWELDVAQRYGAYSVGLRSLEDPGIAVPAVDSGTGVTQVLPLLVRRAQDELDPPGRDVLEIVEEPELHLHPSAQAGLADLYRLAISRCPRVRFLIETHSETFLLRIQRRVAEQKLDPDDVVIYYVDHDRKAASVKRINIDSFGNVDFWPEGIFEESFEEAKALSNAQAERLDLE